MYGFLHFEAERCRNGGLYNLFKRCTIQSDHCLHDIIIDKSFLQTVKCSLGVGGKEFGVYKATDKTSI